MTLCRHCLTAVLSDRSEDKLVFLNQCPDVRFVRQERKFKRTRCAFSAAERMGIDDESDQVP
jgi:hypothetical protein